MRDLVVASSLKPTPVQVGGCSPTSAPSTPGPSTSPHAPDGSPSPTGSATTAELVFSLTGYDASTWDQSGESDSLVYLINSYGSGDGDYLDYEDAEITDPAPQGSSAELGLLEEAANTLPVLKGGAVHKNINKVPKNKRSFYAEIKKVESSSSRVKNNASRLGQSPGLSQGEIDVTVHIHVRRCRSPLSTEIMSCIGACTQHPVNFKN